ncbi:MAG: hypothetical protein H8D23_20045 [Candidatus Brocadiales bacterium]|nr:hypothetical protein [Candidatus Brocadiales bacterium]
MKTIITGILFLLLFVFIGNCYVQGEGLETGKNDGDKIQSKHEEYKIYLVTYKLTREKSFYKRLYSELKNNHSYYRYNETCWLICTSEDIKHLNKRLHECVKQYDTFLIIEVGKKVAGHLPEKAWTWINKNLE